MIFMTYILTAVINHSLCILIYLKIKKIAHWADEFSTDAFGEMLAII